MPAAKHLSKETILLAMSKTLSVRSAARHLGLSYTHLKKWMKFYKDVETGKTLFDVHKNRSGKGIPKFVKTKGKEPAIMDIVEGRISASSFEPQKIKYRMIEAGLLKEECVKCKFNERRVVDYKIPLILNFKDKNKSNYALHNVELMCYNCCFLYAVDVFTGKDIEQMESHVPLNNTTKAIEFELDDYHLQRLKELGLMKNDPTDDNYISRI